MVLAIKNGKVFTAAGQKFDKATVLTENGKITAVGENVAIPEGAQVIDAEGCWVTPGFVEPHTHISLMGEPRSRGGFGDVNETIDPVTSHVRAIDAFDPCNMALEVVRRGGFTTACVLPGSANVIGGEGFAFKLAPKETIDEMVLPGTRVMKFAMGENPRGAYQSGKIKTRMGTAAILRETLFKAKEYADAKANGEKVKFDFKLEALVPVVRGEMMCRFHCHRSDDIATVLRIAEEFHLKFALEHATEGFKLADKLAEKNIICTIGPLVSGPYKQEVWERNLMTPARLTKAGVTVCLTEDSASLTKLLPMHIGLCIRSGLSWDDALKAITINPATLLGVADRLGTLEVGKDADIAVWDGDPFCNYTNCLHTIIDGQVFTHDLTIPQMA
ncbi:MAG: amidohydrolase [Ruminococcaceae bacterium]|nr:amidohydrolase [Oscillospiraceae bacterium]